MIIHRDAVDPDAFIEIIEYETDASYAAVTGHATNIGAVHRAVARTASLQHGPRPCR